MVACKNCSTPNSLDSTFCKHCGTALPDAEVVEAKEKLETLIAEGTNAFNEGRTSEAMAVAELAVASNPSSIAAVSLMALCYERRGMLAEALECADKIVELNPDSELDRIKRNQLRTKLSASVQLATQPPDKRAPLIAAVASVVLVVCVGYGAAKFFNRADTPKGSNAVVLNDPTTAQTKSAVTSPQTPPQQQTAPPAGSVVGPQPVDTGEQDGRGPLPTRSTDPSEIVLDPDVNRPIQPPGPTGQIGGQQGSGVQKPTAITEVKRPENGLDPSPGTDSATGAGAQNNDPGQIEIKISGGNGERRPQSGGSIDTASVGGVSALNRIGIEKYQLGNFTAAASAFDQAIRGGGDQVKLNQWLAKCYDKLGKKSDEIEAYTRCIAASQTALNSGAGNKAQIQATMDTAQQALKVLQGN